MECPECDKLLVSYMEYLHGDEMLNKSEMLTVEEHIETCPSCRAKLERLQGLRQYLCDLFKSEIQSDVEDRIKQVMKRIIQERPR